MTIDLVTIIYLISILLILVMVFLEKADPRSIALWAVVLICLPILGFIIYLFFGQTFYGKKQFEIKNIDDEKRKEYQDLVLNAIDKEHISREGMEPHNMAMALMKMGGSMYARDNDVTLYNEGEKFFHDLYEDIKNAKTFIHLEFYIIRNDKLANELLDILIEKAKEGVEVRLMFDALGIKGSIRNRCLELIRVGGEFALFHSLVTVLFSPRKNNRNHRKLAVIDGTIGYVAGFNIGDEYLGKGPLGYWRDAGIRVQGNATIPINVRFFMDWGYAAKKHIELYEKYMPLDLETKYGDDMMQLISGGPDSGSNPIAMQYLKIINSAKRTLYIHTPYLVPDNSTMQALEMAAASGVDVKIIMPDKPDHPFVYWTSLWYASELMSKGVRVFQYNRGFVHAKTMVADGHYCSVGSANLDQRSMNLNFETNAMIYSKDIGGQMDDAFLDDLTYCTEYTMEEHNASTTKKKFKMSISRLFSSLA